MHTTPDSRKRKKKKRRKVDDVVSNDRAKRKRRDNLLKRLRENSDSLSKDRKRVLTIVGSGHNAFFTGSAGTGKSHLLRHLLKVMDSATTFVTAPTGIAACNVGGITLQYVSTSYNFHSIYSKHDDVKQFLCRHRFGQRRRVQIGRSRETKSTSSKTMGGV